MKIKCINPKNGFKTSDRKENHYYKSLVLLAPFAGEVVQIAELRYYGTGSKNYAAFWLHSHYDKGTKKHQAINWASGTGNAGGYGYDRESAAAHYAIKASGVELSDPVDGRGDSAVRDALLSIARYLGYKKPLIISTHA